MVEVQSKEAGCPRGNAQAGDTTYSRPLESCRARVDILLCCRARYFSSPFARASSDSALSTFHFPLPGESSPREALSPFRGRLSVRACRRACVELWRWVSAYVGVAITRALLYCLKVLHLPHIRSYLCTCYLPDSVCLCEPCRTLSATSEEAALSQAQSTEHRRKNLKLVVLLILRFSLFPPSSHLINNPIHPRLLKPLPPLLLYCNTTALHGQHMHSDVSYLTSPHLSQSIQSIQSEGRRKNAKDIYPFLLITQSTRT